LEIFSGKRLIRKNHRWQKTKSDKISSLAGKIPAILTEIMQRWPNSGANYQIAAPTELRPILSKYESPDSGNRIQKFGDLQRYIRATNKLQRSAVVDFYKCMCKNE
jgi:hypothetical protein